MREPDGSLLSAPDLTRHDRLQRSATLDKSVISFAGGLPDPATFPKRDLATALTRVLSDPDARGLQYGWPEGMPSLRAYVRATLHKRGAQVDESQVLITSGAQQAMVLAFSACATAGDSVAVDDITYPGALDALKNMNAQPVPLSADARAYYVMPGISNPLGQRMSADERAQLLQRVRANQAFVIEDDAYCDTAFSPRAVRPLMSDAPESVFHVGTFSKTLCPGLRVGWLVSPRDFAKPVLDAKQTQDLQANSLAQSLLDAYLQLGRFDQHVSTIRRTYQRRAKRLMESVTRHLPSFRFAQPEGGFSLWLEGDLRLDEDVAYERALEHGVTFDSAQPFRREPGESFALRLCYSSVPEEKIDEGVVRLAAALRTLTS